MNYYLWLFLMVVRWGTMAIGMFWIFVRLTNFVHDRIGWMR